MYAASGGWNINWFELSISDSLLSFATKNLAPEIKVYPNPAKDFLIIETNKEILKANVFAVDGQLLLSKMVFTNSVKLELPINTQPRLVLVNILLQDGAVITKKIMVNANTPF